MTTSADPITMPHAASYALNTCSYIYMYGMILHLHGLHAATYRYTACSCICIHPMPVYSWHPPPVTNSIQVTQAEGFCHVVEVLPCLRAQMRREQVWLMCASDLVAVMHYGGFRDTAAVECAGVLCPLATA